MKLNQVDLNLFLVFDAIYREQNLTRAADSLYITQPAVSNALNRLRKTFDDPLFVRSPRGMLPTPVAKSVATRVREALQLMDTSLNERKSFEPASEEKVVACSMNDMAEALVLPRLLAYLQQHAPHVSLNSYYVPREDAAKELAAGTLDLAIDVPLITDPNLVNTLISDVEYICAVRKDHPLVRESLSLEQYLSLSHVLVSSRRKGFDAVDLALKKQGLRRQVQVRLQHYMAAPEIVANTDLAWTLPLGLAQQYADLKILPLPFDVPELGRHLFWHKSADQDPANRWIREIILAGAK